MEIGILGLPQSGKSALFEIMTGVRSREMHGETCVRGLASVPDARFDRIAEAFGCHAEYVEDPVQLPAALRRAQAAVAQGRTALVNVVTDGRVVAETTKFSRYMT